jgi:polyisoprenoid-binding protein YceI
MRFLSGLLAAALLTAVAVAAEFPLTADNTHVTFVGSKKEGKHDGGFKKLHGTAKMTGTDPTTAKITVTIDTTSIYTDTPKLTNHLKSADFFDVKTNPTAKFVSKKVETLPGHPGIYNVAGDLTLNGKTRAISFPAAISVRGGVLHLNSEFKINRHDFGMSYGKGKVHDVVELKVKLDAAGDTSKK